MRPPAWRQARDELWKRLQDGSIEAFGIPLSGGVRKPIPAHEWRDLGIYDELRGRIVVRADRGLGGGYDDVSIARVTVTKLWSAARAKRSAKTSALNACRRWLEEARRSGPPTKTRAQYKAEAMRRFEVGPDQFRTAWRLAAAEVPKDDWGNPGAPPKRNIGRK
jgi:hypothetical protein